MASYRYERDIDPKELAPRKERQYLSDFYIGMRGAWNTATAENLAGGEELWQALTAGAVSTLREG